MERFIEFIGIVKQFPLLFAFLLTPPLTNLFLPIGPPENVIWVTFVTALFAAGTLMLIYLTSEKEGSAAVRIARYWIAAGMVLVLAYLFTYFLFVCEVPAEKGNSRKVAIGFVYLSQDHKDVVKTYATNCEAVAANNGDPYGVFTSSSIAIIRLLLVVLWMGCFCAGYGAIAMFIRAIAHPSQAPPTPAPVPPNASQASNPDPAPSNPAPVVPNPNPPPQNPAPSPPKQPKKNNPKNKQ